MVKYLEKMHQERFGNPVWAGMYAFYVPSVYNMVSSMIYRALEEW